KPSRCERDRERCLLAGHLRRRARRGSGGAATRVGAAFVAIRNAAGRRSRRPDPIRMPAAGAPPPVAAGGPRRVGTNLRTMPDLVLSHYRILERLGEGGMGVVYLARDERLQRNVAIKMLHPDALANDSSRSRFRTEALALSRLNHPGIAIVHAFDQENDADYLVMEF